MSFLNLHKETTHPEGSLLISIAKTPWEFVAY